MYAAISRANVMSIKRKTYLAGSRALTGCHVQGDDTVFRLEMDGMAPTEDHSLQKVSGNPAAVG